MFTNDEVTVEAPLDVAVPRLVNLLRQGALTCASEAAYEGGFTAVLRIGPFGGKFGFSKLVRVCYLEPAQRNATMTVPLRWEATGTTGELFPVLDADLILARHGDSQTLLALTGSYRPPFGLAGAILDKAIMHRLAASTIRSLLVSVSDAIAGAVPAPLPETGTPLVWEAPVVGPGAP